MIDLLNLHPAEAERIAYAEGFTMAAELFKRIADAQTEAEFWREKSEQSMQEAIEANAECENLRMELLQERSQ